MAEERAIVVEPVWGEGLTRALPEVARLRMEVFRAFPYLYDGDEEYERRYLADYARSEGAVVVLAREGERVVGAATAAPLGDHQPQLADAFRREGFDPADVFYLAESVLDPAYRGRGIGHRFFDAREAAAREQGYALAAFCGVVRESDHPRRPESYRPLDEFWQKRGYRKVPGLTSEMRWRDLGAREETEKPMQFWIREL